MCWYSLINVLHSHLELCSNYYCLAYLLPLSFLLVLCIIHNCYYYHDVHYNLLFSLLNVSQFIIALAWVMIISALKNNYSARWCAHICLSQHTTGVKIVGLIPHVPYAYVNYICTVQSMTIDLQSWKKDCHGLILSIIGLFTCTLIHGPLHVDASVYIRHYCIYYCDRIREEVIP